MSNASVKHNGSLDSALVAHRLQGLPPLLQLKHLVNNSIHANLTRVQIRDRIWELVGLAEASEDGDFISD